MKKGFTLAELMGVIVIIGIIATIVAFSVDRSLKSSKEKACIAQEKTIIEAAKMWSIDNAANLANLLNSTNTTYEELTIGTLKDGGYLDDDLKSAMTNQSLSNNTKIKISVSTDSIVIDGETVNPTYEDYNYEIIYVNGKEKCN